MSLLRQSECEENVRGGIEKTAKKTILEQAIANVRNYFWLFHGKISRIYLSLLFCMNLKLVYMFPVPRDAQAATLGAHCLMWALSVVLFSISASSCNKETLSLTMSNFAALNSPKIYQNIGSVTEYF